MQHVFPSGQVTPHSQQNSIKHYKIKSLNFKCFLSKSVSPNRYREVRRLAGLACLSESVYCPPPKQSLQKRTLNHLEDRLT